MPPMPTPPPPGAFWDERYRTDAYIYGEQSTPYLVAQRERLRPRTTALVPGDGEGRDGVWLAEQGLDVTTVDVSAEGVRKALELAQRRGVTLAAVQADLTTWDWPVAAFDLVASIYLHLPPAARAAVHRRMAEALRPGGLLVIEAFRPEQVRFREAYGSVGGPQAVEMMMTEAMLREDFADLDVVELASEETDHGNDGAHRGRAAVVRGVFRRPA